MEQVKLSVDRIKGTAQYQNNQSDDLIVFLHGWGGSATSFDPLVEALESGSAKKIDTLQLNLPGFGDSDMPPTEGWNTNQYAQWFSDWIKKLQTNHPHYKKIVLYGHSFGCRVIVRFLLQNPDWTHPVILTGAAGIKHPLPSRAKIAQLITKIIRPIKSLIPERIKKIVLRKIFKAHDWAAAPEALKKTLSIVLKEEDLRDYLPQIKNRTLILWGKNDTYTPISSGKIFAQKLPNAKLIVFETGKHGIHYTHKTEIVSEIQKFLAE